MAQGRTRSTGNSDGNIAFMGDGESGYRSRRGAASRGTEDRSSGLTTSIVSGLMPEIADQWLMDSIERKRAMLHEITVLQRHRIEEFVELLFDETTDRCQRLVDTVAAECGDPQTVVERLFEPAARVIGESWCADDCDFFKVTIAMSRMQRLFRRLTSDFPPAPRPTCRALRCSPRRPANSTRSASRSWTTPSGAAAGKSTAAAARKRRKCTGWWPPITIRSLACRSASIGCLPELAPIVQKLRSKSRNRSVVIMAGGSMVMQNPQAAIDAGFDLLAVDATSAVALAEAAFGSTLIVPNQRMAAE